MLTSVRSFSALHKAEVLKPLKRTLIKNLDAVKVGTEVSLSGWLQSLRPAKNGLLFAELRDHSGSMQIILEESKVSGYKDLEAALKSCAVESVISVTGTLLERPAKTIRSDSLRDRFEIVAEDLKILNKASESSFNPFGSVLPSEELRLRDRFLDLRRPILQENLRMRASINEFLRTYFSKLGFVEIETPMLFKSTPEGAKEFLVPTATGDEAYALPQSPQQFKQMLMASGFDRYYQIARCFRNEDLRSDRQPEFTQLDMEMSFITSQEDVMEVIEEAVRGMLKTYAPNEICDDRFQRMEYSHVMSLYGCDKPDTRYPFMIECMNKREDIVLEKLDLSELSRNLIPEGNEGGVFTAERSLNDHNGATILGRIRNEVIRRIEAAGLQSTYQIKGASGLLWVHNFPLFSAIKNPDHDPLHANRRYQSLHHPFTAPMEDDIAFLDSDPSRVHGQHYDLVWKGVEIGGGSVRIHSAELQEHILRNIIGLSSTHLEHFDHLLRALKSGCPPHGGMALGLDRLIAMIRGSQSIRDVIAFPKNGKGRDLCVNTPSKFQ